MTARSAPYFPQTVTGDGATKEFLVPFGFIDAAHLIVINNGTMGVLGTDYFVESPRPNEPSIYTSHVSGADTSKSRVRFATAPGNGNTVKFYRNTPIARPATPAGVQLTDHMVSLYAHYRNQEADDIRIKVFGVSNQVDTLAGTAQTFAAPCDGYVEKLRTIVTAAVTTGGPVTVLVDGVAVTGLSVSIANSAAVGNTLEDTPTTAQSATTKVRRGQTISVVPDAAFATAGSYNFEVEIQPADLT